MQEEGAPPRSCGVVDLALYLRSLAASKCERREAPSEGTSVDENLPISGRSPQFFCHRSSQRSLGERVRRSGQPRTSEQDAYRTIARSRVGSRVAPSRISQPTPGHTASIEFVKILCFRYTFAMSKIENIYEIVTDNHGLITSARAREVEISSNELVRYAKRGRIAKVGHGLYQLEQWVPGPNDAHAWAVMSVGPDALLYGESVIALPDLTPTNPTRTFVAAPRRTRRASKA